MMQKKVFRHLSAKQKSISTTLRLLIALLVLAGCLLSANPPRSQIAVSAESTSEALAEAKQKQEELAAEKARLEKETRQLAAEVDKLSGELAWLNERSDEQRKLYEEKTIQLAAAVDAMEEAYSDLIAAEEDLAAKQEQYAARVNVMFEHRQKSIFQVFLESESLQGFFTTLQFINIVADTDEQLIEELEIAKDHAALKRDIARQYSVEMSELVTRIEADLAQLRADSSARKIDLNQAELKLTTHEKAEDDLLVESEQLAGQIVELQKKLEAEKAAAATAAAKAERAAAATSAAKATKAAEATRAAQKPTQAPKPSTGSSTQTPNSRGWVWPYPGDYNVYSSFGMRLHPIYRYYRMHTGVDLGGKYGNPIVAAASGTVLLVVNPREGSNTGGSGYGNYIVISHGDGLSTLYAHLKNTLVKTGQSVKAGDKIATCGSTGASTGPHLHFEVRVNGNPVNPLPYIR
ncbi:MAG: peptidoglycan DD-metalloendopeptidase family protein [Bacillota bacterium]|nr:peptidoglycan DD-metalloendopeptidase family protein [Bacillota bacterium]